MAVEVPHGDELTAEVRDLIDSFARGNATAEIVPHSTTATRDGPHAHSVNRAQVARQAQLVVLPEDDRTHLALDIRGHGVPLTAVPARQVLNAAVAARGEHATRVDVTSGRLRQHPNRTVEAGTERVPARAVPAPNCRHLGVAVRRSAKVAPCVHVIAVHQQGQDSAR